VILALSHLRWEALPDTARQLLQQLAGLDGKLQLLFMQEPLLSHAADAPYMDSRPAGPFIDIVVPRTAGCALQPGFCAGQQNLLQQLLGQYCREQSVDVTAIWLNTPMAWPLAESLLNQLPWSAHPRRVIYDCSEQPVQAPAAAPALARQEQSLLRAADLVLCAQSAIAAPRQEAAGRRLAQIPKDWKRAAASLSLAFHS
jgi:hypothetical protein